MDNIGKGIASAAICALAYGIGVNSDNMNMVFGTAVLGLFFIWNS